MISTFNPQEVLNKWTGRHITEERAKNTKNDQVLSLRKSLASFFTKKTYLGPSLGSHYSESPISLLPTEVVQTLAVTFRYHGVECKRLSPKWINEVLPV